MMCTPIVIQYRLLENLLAALPTSSQVSITVLQESQTTTSPALVRKALKISVDVRAVASGNRILSWHCPVDEFSFYTGTGSSPEQGRYERAWQRAETIKDDLAEAITGVAVYTDVAVRTDGVIELPVSTLLPGTTNLVHLQPVGPAAPVLAEVV